MPVILRRKTALIRSVALAWAVALVIACSQTPPAPAAPTLEPAAATATPQQAASPVVENTPSPTLTPLPTAEPKPAGNPAVTPPVAASDEPPERDLFDLARRFKSSSDEPLPRTVESGPASYEVGHADTFWVSDIFDQDSYTVQAILRLVSENAYWYVDSSVSLSLDDLEKAAEAYEREVRPAILASIGDVWNPGVDNDPRITILHTPLRGVAGYYGSRDQYTREIHPRSNQREMLYMNATGLTPGSSEYLGVLAHELQHAVHWNLDAGEDSWVNEGMAELVKELAGYRASFINTFLIKSDTQLNFWPEEPRNTPPHYGAANLFMAYLAQHYGGHENLKALIEQQADGDRGVDAYLSEFGVAFEDVFKDWVVANYLDADDGKYSYPDRSARVRDLRVMSDGGALREALPQFSARYALLNFDEGDALVRFEGESQARQVETECHSYIVSLSNRGSGCWWGNRGDSIDSTLTREFDLSGLDSATLEFWTWFELEQDWDYAYVAASTDGGETWRALEGSLTTGDNANGNNLGDGFTGESSGWVKEQIDLTPFSGGRLLLRFEYVTDDAVYRDGFVIDDIAIPELGFFDAAEQDDIGWDARGFVRFDNVLPQKFFVQVIEQGTDGSVTVRDVELDEANRGELLLQGFGSRLEQAVVVVSPVTRDTSHPAQYTLTVDSP